MHKGFQGRQLIMGGMTIGISELIYCVEAAAGEQCSF